ncbi:hypothetical protein D9M71_602090 [compost metagenome]
MPMSTINASQRIEVRSNGNTAQTTARQERKAMNDKMVTAPNTRNSICRLAAFTTMLVAASIPALPAPKMKCTSEVLLALANVSTTPTTCSRLSALWSFR